MLWLATCQTNTINNQSSSEPQTGLSPCHNTGSAPLSDITDTKQDKCAGPHNDTIPTISHRSALQPPNNILMSRKMMGVKVCCFT